MATTGRDDAEAAVAAARASDAMRA
jgi:hypothetical protein